MTVFNGMPYLPEAVISVLTQTYEDFELLVVDDGSTDESLTFLNGLTDPRLRVVERPHLGLVSALNAGLDQAAGRLLARMDSDDVCSAHRLERQVTFMDHHSDIGLVCSDVTVTDEHGVRLRSERERWSPRQNVQSGLLYERRMMPIIHPTVMFRLDLLRTHGMRYREFTCAEDRDLWIRFSSITRFARIRGDLVAYRSHQGGISRTAESEREQQLSSAMAAVNWNVLRQTGVDMFEMRPELFRESRDWLRGAMNDRLDGAVEAFREVRSLARSGSPLGALRKLLGSSLELRTIIGRDTSRAITCDLVQECTTLSTARVRTAGT